MYNYSKLKGRITEICGNQGEFAKGMKFSERTASLKMNQKSFFRQDEIERAIEVLKLTIDDIQTYFFTKEVQY